MKPLIEQRPIISNTESKVFKLHNNSTVLRHLTQLVVTQQYSNPTLAAIREIVSNAYDANLEAEKEDGVKRAVNITLLEDRVIVRDYGFGLSHEWMMDGYAAIANSTKHDDQDLIGAKGIGRLAPLAVSKQYFVTSYYCGTASTYCVFLNENSEIAISLWNQDSSNEPSGLEVTIICPNNGHNKKEHIEDLIKYVYTVTEGSRHQINLDLTAVQDEDDKLLWVNDYKTGSAVDDGFTVDLYSIQKLTHEASTQIFIDLGGALYPYKCQDKHNWYAYSEHLKNHTESYLQDLLTSYKPSSTDFSHLSISKTVNCTLIIRVSPDYLMLNTSREAVLKTIEQLEKQSDLVDKALAAIEPVYAQLLQNAIQQDYNERVHNEDSVYYRLHNFYLSVISHRKSGYLHLQNDHNMSFNLGDGWTCSTTTTEIITGDATQALIEVNDKQIIIKKANTQYYDYDNQYGKSYYYLAANNSYLQNVLTHQQHSWGVNKITPKSSSRRCFPVLDQRLMLQVNPTVVLVQDSSQPSLKQLEKFFNISLQYKSVLVVHTNAATHDRLVAFMPLFDYLGIYSSGKEPTERTQTTRVIPEVSILLRQLKQSGVTRLGRSSTLSDEEITPALLQEKVIFFNKECDWKGKLAKNVPAKYLSNYHELAFYLTENAFDRVQQLVADGKCNWVEGADLDGELTDALYKDYGYLVNYMGSGPDGYSDDPYKRRQALNAIVKMGLGEYLPDLTRSLANCSSKLITAFKVASSHSTKLNIQSVTSELFAPYKGDYPCKYDALLGPFLSPYYNHFISNYSTDKTQELLCETIAFKLKADKANIYK